MTPDDSINDELYVEVGDYHAPECKRLFDLLILKSIRFEYEPIDDPSNITPNGSSGWNFMIKVFAHYDDQKMFHQVHRELFGTNPGSSGQSH